MRRREAMQAASAALLSLAGGRPAWTAAPATRKVLYFTRSAGFEHSVVKRSGAGLSHSEKILAELGRRDGFDIECTKDGRVFDGNLAQYDAVVFYTTGDLTKPAADGSPPMTAAGKRKLLEAIEAGKGFMGLHSATDTFHSRSPANENQAEVDPYIAMIGGEFLTHGEQQEASLFASSALIQKRTGVPAEGLSFTEEWYTFKNFARDLHVILVQETAMMKGAPYRRPDFPSTWARMHGRGRVFYTSLGHREEVWSDPLFQTVPMSGLAWVTGRFDFEIAPNIDKATPQANRLRA